MPKAGAHILIGWNWIMSTLQSTEAIGTAVKASGTTKRSLFLRWFDALAAGRMRKAEREIREHLRFLPDDLLRRAGYRRREPG
ncbi:MAG: hypothetical protein K2Z80_23280 [Xanthobacteraceae bacterium]|nr:hypothetical protein [Xanthobacteraceae bacterium]